MNMRTCFRFLLIILMMSMSFPASSQDLLKKIYVSDHYVNCHAAGQSKCLLIKDSVDGNWRNYFGSIEGLRYEEGYDYELMVEIHTVKNNPGDTTVFHYSLIKILNKTRKHIAARYRLDDRPWFLEKIEKGKKLRELKKLDAFIILSSDEKRITGNSGCNRFSGNLTVNETTIRVDNLASTKMSCLPYMNELEFSMLKNLQDVDTYSVKSGKLYLFKSGKLLLVFRRK